jgi:hypothetical protein
MNNKAMQKPTLDMKNFISKKRFFVIYKYAKQIVEIQSPKTGL